MKNSTLIIRSLAVIAVLPLPIFASYGESDAEKNKSTEMNENGAVFVRGPLKDFRFGDDGTLTFLMLADWHLGAMSLDVIKKHVAGFKAVIHENKPSFIVLAGDNLSTRKNAVGQFERLMTPFVELLKETRTPLCVTFGNHDSESTPANPGYYSRQAQYDWLKSRLGELFVDHDVPELSGVGTGVIPIYAKAPGKAAFKVYVVDSGDYPARAGNGLPSSAYGWDNPRSDQIAWYMRESADKVPHVYIQHIIVPDILVTGLFEPAKEKEEGAFPFDKTLFPEDKVEKGGGRYFWMKPGARLMTSPDAKCNERPSPPRWNTYTDVYHTVGGTTLYNAWIKSRCMKGAFFGHDHSNSFDAVDDNGIRFGGCVVFNWGAYRVFKIREDGTYETWLKRMIIE